MDSAARAIGLRNYLQAPLPSEQTASITGNVPLHVKELPLKWLALRNPGKRFAENVALELKVTDVSVVPNRDDPSQMEARLRMEIEVTPDMCNAQGTLSEACMVYLIDDGSAMATIVIDAYNGRFAPPGVSQSINASFHASALSGTKLYIINRAIASERESKMGTSEIWDIENHRLIASGSQITMSTERGYSSL